MLICLSNLSFKKLSFDNFILKAKKLNFKEIEIAPSLISKNPYTKSSIKKLKKKIKKENLKIISIQSLFFNYNKKKNFKNILSHFKKIFNFAKKLNIKKISLGNAPFRKSLLEEKKYIKLFSCLSSMAINYNVKLCIEPLNKKYKNKFLINHNEVINFLKLLKKKNIKLLFDFGNFSLGEKKLKVFLKKNICFIEHVHLSEKNLFKLNVTNIKKNLDYLKKAGYKKSVSIEYINDYGEGLLEKKKYIKKNV